MCFGKDLLSYRKRFVHFWGKILCISEIILCIFFFGGGGGGIFVLEEKFFIKKKILFIIK